MHGVLMAQRGDYTVEWISSDAVFVIWCRVCGKLIGGGDFEVTGDLWRMMKAEPRPACRRWCGRPAPEAAPEVP